MTTHPRRPETGCAPRSAACATSSRCSTTTRGTDPSPIPELSLGDGVLTLWYDTYVHADDVRDAIGAPSDRGAGLGASIGYLARELTTRGWGPATLALDDVPTQTVGGGGPTVAGDPLEFVLVATGRRDPGALGLDATVNIYAAR